MNNRKYTAEEIETIVGIAFCNKDCSHQELANIINVSSNKKGQAQKWISDNLEIFGSDCDPLGMWVHVSSLRSRLDGFKIISEDCETVPKDFFVINHSDREVSIKSNDRDLNYCKRIALALKNHFCEKEKDNI